jgi:GNAT superfamily N-acetyltransferase
MRQIGFARVVSDCTTFAYLTDVFIVDTHRGQGLSKRLIQTIIEHSQLQGLRRFLLVTEDAGGLYSKFGFQPLADVDHWMQIYNDF